MPGEAPRIERQLLAARLQTTEMSLVWKHKSSFSAGCLPNLFREIDENAVDL